LWCSLTILLWCSSRFFFAGSHAVLVHSLNARESKLDALSLRLSALRVTTSTHHHFVVQRGHTLEDASRLQGCHNNVLGVCSERCLTIDVPCDRPCVLGDKVVIHSQLTSLCLGAHTRESPSKDWFSCRHWWVPECVCASHGLCALPPNRKFQTSSTKYNVPAPISGQVSPHSSVLQPNAPCVRERAHIGAGERENERLGVKKVNG
jgi:hypothetical protein